MNMKRALVLMGQTEGSIPGRSGGGRSAKAIEHATLATIRRTLVANRPSAGKSVQSPKNPQL
jgi:hypothetical protein